MTGRSPDAPDDGRKPIKLPVNAPVRKTARDVVEAVAGEIPIAGPVVVAVLRNAMPPPEEKDRERWEGEVTKETNLLSDTVERHDRLLRPRSERITGLAATLAAFLVHLPHDGLLQSYALVEMASDIPGHPTTEALLEAASELAMHGLVEVKPLSGGHAIVRPRPTLFEQLDPQIMGWDPAEDARRLASLLLQDESRCAIARLHDASGWDRRRFNPAVRCLLKLFEPTRISQEIQPDYPTNQVIMDGVVKARLRRFTARTATGQEPTAS